MFRHYCVILRESVVNALAILSNECIDILT